MEIKGPVKFVRSYWQLYRQRSLFLIISMQIITALVVALALAIVGLVHIDDLGFIVLMIAIVASSIGINVLVFSITSEPLHMLANALTHVAGEQTTTTPPNPNATRYEKNGLKPLLQLIYELSSNQQEVKANEKEEAETLDFSTILNETSTAIIFMDTDGKVVYANKAAPVKVTADGGMELDIVIDNDPSVVEWLKDLNETNIHAERTWKRIANKLPGGEDRRLFDMVASYQNGSEIPVVLTLIERTDDYLPEDNELDFISFAAHELRGPITVIRGYLDTLHEELKPGLEDEQIELFNRLTVSANRLSSYVNNILNAAKFDRRHLRVYLNEEKVSDIYQTIGDDMRLRAATQQRNLTVDIPTSLPTVAADKASIGEVIGNLVDNAIKYSNEGGTVALSARAVGDTVEVSVSDQGIGMPGNVVSNLFAKFYRSHRSRETVAGTGIGLYICKAIVESHGGEISVRSVEGEGSTFSFTLPIYATVAEKLKASHNSNEELIQHHDGWIKNHGSFRG